MKVKFIFCAKHRIYKPPSPITHPQLRPAKCCGCSHWMPLFKNITNSMSLRKNNKNGQNGTKIRKKNVRLFKLSSNY